MIPGVLYAIVCGSPPAQYVGDLVTLARNRGWEVCVIASPDGRKFIDAPALAALTGHPVRSVYKNPGDIDVLPDPTAMVVAPATVNTINKWAAGIADTLPLGLVVEGIGKGVPLVTIPFTNVAMAAHPAFGESLAKLRSWGVRVIDALPLHAPGTGGETAADFPWHLALEALDEFD